ncbi:MAG: phosphoglucomutase [Paludibacter sp.]|nr:phosphoglucomutase [Paludibacter sp.]
MNIFFGTDGWRTYLDSHINEESVAVVAQAFSDYVNLQGANQQIAVAYDTRRNSTLFASIFSEVLSGNGIKVLLSDKLLPTPVLSFTTKFKNCLAGVMITASHNPPAYNGIKFKSSLGGPFSSEETRKIENLLYKSTIRKSNEHVVVIDMMPDYISHIESLIDFNAIRQARIPLLIDSMGGSGTDVLQDILQKHDCSATTIFGEPSESFYGRLAEPIEQNLAPLMAELSRRDFAFGVATDGDADRMGVCLDNGEWLSAQNTILLLVDYLKRVKKESGGIVKTSSVTDKIRSFFETEGVQVHEVQVGFKYIADIMVQEMIAFGGEESGGFGYGMHIPERDGIFSSLLLLEMLAVSRFNKLSAYLADRQTDMGEVYYDRIDAHYSKSDKNNLLPWAFEYKPLQIGTYNIVKTISFLSSRGIVNGLKFVFEGDCRWLLIRSSETEDMIRYYAEGHSDSEVQELLNLGQSFLNEISTKNIQS